MGAPKVGGTCPCSVSGPATVIMKPVFSPWEVPTRAPASPSRPAITNMPRHPPAVVTQLRAREMEESIYRFQARLLLLPLGRCCPLSTVISKDLGAPE